MRLVSLVVLIGVVVITGCRHSTETAPHRQHSHPQIMFSTVQEGPVLNDNVSIIWSKLYTVNLTDGRKLTIKSKKTPWRYLSEEGIEFEAKVMQDNDKWVYFDCSAIADKIIQPELVTELSHWCGIILPLATTYWEKNNPPPEMTDSDGNVWTLKTKGNPKF